MVNRTLTNASSKVNEIDKVDFDGFSLRSYLVDSRTDGFSFCHGGPAAAMFQTFQSFSNNRIVSWVILAAMVGITVQPNWAFAQYNYDSAPKILVSSPSAQPNNELSASDRTVDRLGSTQLTSTVAATEASSSSLEILIEPLEEQKSPPVVTAMSASHDGKYLAIAGDDHVIRLFDVGLQKTVRELSGHIDWIQSLVFSADSHVLYSSGNDGRVLRWEHKYPAAPTEIVRLPFAVRSLSLASERQLLAIGGFSDDVRIWNLATRAWKHQFKCDCSDQRCVRFSPSGDELLCGGRDGGIRVWNVKTGELITDKHLHQSRVFTAAFSRDGDMITSAGEDGHLIRFDLTANKVKMDRELAKTKFMSMCLINDQLVAVAGSDNSIRLYDMVVGEVIAKLNGHFGTVAIMCPCGEMLASGSFDTSVRIWDLEAEVLQQAKFSMPVGLAPLDVDAKMRIR